MAEIGYFLLALLTSRGAHERHYEFIGSREPNELPSPGIYRRQKSLILNVLFFPWHFHDRLPIFPAPLLFTLPPSPPILPPPRPRFHIIFTTGARFPRRLGHTFDSVFCSRNLFKKKNPALSFL